MESFLGGAVRFMTSGLEDDMFAGNTCMVAYVLTVLASMAAVICLFLRSLGLCGRRRASPVMAIALIALILPLWRFTATRAGSFKLDLPATTTYPAHWPFTDVTAERRLDLLTEVPRLRSAPFEEAQLWTEIYEQGLPVVFEGALAELVESGDWTPARLTERLRLWEGTLEGEAPIFWLQMGHPEQQATVEMPCRFSDFASRLEDEAWQSGCKRLYNGTLPYFAEESFPPLSEHGDVQRTFMLEMPEYWKRREALGATQYRSLRWWIGFGGVRSGLHADPENVNVLNILHGTKTFNIYRPADIPNLYPAWKFDNGATSSAVDPFSPDLSKYPRFAEARPMVAELGPGDVLVVPAGWFHFVESTSTSVSFSARALTTWQLLSFWDVVLMRGMAGMGLFEMLGISATFGTPAPVEGPTPCELDEL